MPLYELFCISASSSSSAPLRDLIKGTSSLILQHGGVVRGVQYWGRRHLPQRARRHQQWHTEGDHFLVHFDTNPRVLKSLSSRLQADPRVIKWTTLKLGDKLHDIVPSAVPDDAASGGSKTLGVTGGTDVSLGGGRTIESSSSR